MLDIEPKSLVFRDVRLNQAYTTSLCIANPLPSSVEFTLRPSSPRYTITPNRVNLNGGQSIVVSVRLFLAHYPNYGKGVKGQEDSIQIKSSYFEQKVDVSFFLHSRDTGTARSLSPTTRGSNVKATNNSYETITELQSQLRMKDNKIAQMEEIIGQLESKYPSMQEIIKSRITRERDIFEEKSEKVLKILRRKDETIGQLQAQLNEKNKIIENEREINANSNTSQRRDYWSGKLIDQDLNRENSRIIDLEQSYESLKWQLQEEQGSHDNLKIQLKESQETIEKLTETIENLKSKNKSTVTDSQLQELRGLRERTMDQSEQIDVLVAEVAKLRENVRENEITSEALAVAHAEVNRLQRELEHSNSKYNTLENSFREQQLMALSKAVANNENTDANANANANDSNSDRMAAAASLYQERAAKAEEDNYHLIAKLSEAQKVELALKQTMKDLEFKINDNERQLKSYSEKVSSCNQEKGELFAKLEDKEAQLQSALGKALLQGSKVAENDANVWWSYVWHAMRRKTVEDENVNGNSESTIINNNYTSNNNDDAIQKLKENLRLQAIELTSLRQESLGKRLQSNKEIESLREQLDLARREIIKVNAAARTHKGDKELKMNEMAITIKTLSARGDMHSQVVAARQELEAEKMTCHHLRADIDVYRTMLESEQAKIVAIRKDLATVTSTLESVNVLQTVMDVPGVDPAVLIEAMSGQIIQLHADYSKTRSLLASSTSQIASLQRALANSNGKRSSNINGGIINDKSIENMTPKTRGFDASDIFIRTGSLGLDDANNTFVVDSDMTPHKVLDTLDSALLSQKILELESIIAELRVNVNDAHDEIIKNENSRIQEREEYEAVGRIEIESSIRRQEILQMALDDAKVKISSLRQRCADLEKAAVDIKSSYEIPVLESNPQDNEFDITRDNNDTISTSCTNDNDNREELDATKKLLLERTTQLKIMMDTLDAFHTSGIRPDNDYNSSELGNIGLSDLAQGPIPSLSSSSWGVHALVKRIVELTTDLTSQTAAASMEERKSSQLENDNRKRKTELSKLKAKVRKAEEANAKMSLQVISLTNYMKESERQRIDDTNQLQLENEDLLTALREAEGKIRSHQITIDELNKKLQVTDEQDFQNWLEGLIFSDDNNENDDSAIENDKNNNTNYEGVAELVTSLLNQWKDQVGSYPTTKGRFLSKTEQKFLQRISDLVLGSNERCTNAQAKYRWAEASRTKAELQLKVTKSKLKSCIEHLHRYRKRALAAESIINVDKRHAFMDKEHILSFYQRLLTEERNKYAATSQVLIGERRDRKLIDTKLTAATIETRKLQLKIAELESRGNATLRGRDEAIASLESRLRVSEESLRRWIRVELPRLVSGFPVTEDFMADDEYGAMDGNAGNIASKLASSLGLDKTFAMAQALCAAKAAQTVQDMRLTGVLEKNSILKERNMELEGIISKWRCNFENSRPFTNGSEDIQKVQEKLYIDAEKESNLAEQLSSVKAKLVTIEEENIELKGRLSNTNTSVDEMKKLIDIFLKEEREIKNRASSLITKMRISLENEHANELRLLRESYEAEKNLLNSELDRVASAVEEARVLSSDNIWKDPDYNGTPNSIARGGGGGGHHQNPNYDDNDHNGGGKGNNGGRYNGNRKNDGDNYGSRNDGDDDDDDNNDDNNNDGNKKKMEIQISELQRQLELERSRFQQARNDINELESILNMQRQAFEKSHHLNLSNTHTNTDTPSKIVHDDSNVADAQTAINDSHNKSKTPDNEDSDPSLWPSLGSLVDELAATLKSISNKHKTLSSDTLLKTAIAMTARVGRIAKATPNTNLVNTFTPQKFEYDDNDEVNTSTPGVIQSLQSLASRVKLIETDITDNSSTNYNNASIPERHLFLLRDLRARVMEIEQGVPKEIDRINENARFEKNNLVRELEQRTEELNELRRGQEKTLANVKNRYEEALRSSQETLEEQTSLFNQQIVKLEEYLTRANEQINILKKELDERDKERHSGKSHREEILKMQSLIDNANNELDNYRKKYGDLQKSYDRDVNEMRESFNRYKKAQDIVVQSLESQLQTMNSNANANVNDTSIEFEEKYRKLEYRFKAKSVELDAVMKALARSGNSFEEDSVTNASSVIDLSVPPPHPRSPSRNNYNVNDSGIISNVTISKDIRDDLYEVKIKAAESEIEALSLSLSKEKQANQHLRKQVQGTLEKTGEAMLADHHLHHHSNINTNTDDNGETFLKDTKQEFSIPDGEISRSKLMMMIKKMNDMRIRARTEIMKLNSKIQTNNNHYEELMKLRTLMMEKEKLIADTKDQNQNLREENNRKIKLLNNLKSSKIVLENTLESWKNEARENEENSKRYQKVITTKDTLIKELRARLEGLEETIDKNPSIINTATNSNINSNTNENANYQTDLVALSVTELRNRLRLSELERVRIRGRLTICKDRITELEADIKLKSEEIDRLNRIHDRGDQLREQLTRKDNLLKSLKQSNDKLRQEYDDYKNDIIKKISDNDKKYKSLQRQIENNDRQKGELEKENQMMRKRLNDALESSAQTAMMIGRTETRDIETFGRRSTGTLNLQRPSYDRPYTANTNSNTNTSSNINANIRVNTRVSNEVPMYNEPAPNIRPTYYNTNTNANTNTTSNITNNTNTKFEPTNESNTARNTTTTGNTKSYNVPKSLGAEAGDLNDIMMALGDSSMGIGLGSGLDNSSIVDDDDDTNTMSVESRLKNLVKSSLLDSPHR